MRIQGEEQLRARSVRRRIRQRGAVLDGGMRMPALPVAQMPGAGQAGLARMAMLAVELAAKADSRLVLKRRDARNRAETRRAAQWTQPPSDAHTARNRAKTRPFRGFWGVFRGPGGAEKAPRGGFSLGINALGRPEGVGGYRRRSGTVRCPLSATKTPKKRTVASNGQNAITGDETCRL